MFYPYLIFNSKVRCLHCIYWYPFFSNTLFDSYSSLLKWEGAYEPADKSTYLGYAVNVLTAPRLRASTSAELTTFFSTTNALLEPLKRC